ncbi:unnamed protein product [Penicillium bialowiezense]
MALDLECCHPLLRPRMRQSPKTDKLPHTRTQHKPSIAVPRRGQDNKMKNDLRHRRAQGLRAPQPSSLPHPRAQQVQYREWKQWIDVCILHMLYGMGAYLRGGSSKRSWNGLTRCHHGNWGLVQ